MAHEIIDGTLEPAQPSSRKFSYRRYKSLTITPDGGAPRIFPKVAAHANLEEEIARGGHGRWYLTKADGQLGMFGLRRADGTAKYGHFSNIEPILLVVGILGALVGIARFGFGVEDLPLTPAVLSVLLLGFYFYLRSKRLAAKASFDADAQAAGASA